MPPPPGPKPNLHQYLLLHGKQSHLTVSWKLTIYNYKLTMLHTVRRFEIVDHRSAFFGLEITVIWEKKCIEMHLFNYWYSLSVHHPPAGRPGPHTKLKTFLHEVLHQAPWPAMDHTKPHAPYTDHPHPETRPHDRVGPPTPHERSTAQHSPGYHSRSVPTPTYFIQLHHSMWRSPRALLHKVHWTPHFPQFSTQRMLSLTLPFEFILHTLHETNW